MGLIKTGLVLAGGYGLIKAASRAANDHEDKKQNRQNQNMQPYQGQNESQMGYMYQNQPKNQATYPQWAPNHEQQSHNGHQTQQAQSRSVQDSPMYQPNSMNNCPPPYSESHTFKAKGDHKSGSAREYYYSQ
ncbi:unnamed protein product [Penicillium pancosmium]